jgi:DNA helicase HerA-like ATPase
MDHFEFDPERTVLGTVFTHAGEEVLALTELDRMNHMLVIGKTGMGKTQLLRNIILQDIHTGRGVGVIDPHGDLQHEVLNEYPRWRARDLVYLDPNDPERVVTFIVFADVPPNRIAATAAEIVGALKAVWGEIGWGARMERILYSSIAALLEATHTSFVCLPRFLKDERRIDSRLTSHDQRFDNIDRELHSIRTELDDLHEKVGNITGYRKEIDHALERIAAIEQHLRINKGIST